MKKKTIIGRNTRKAKDLARTRRKRMWMVAPPRHRKGRAQVNSIYNYAYNIHMNSMQTCNSVTFYFMKVALIIFGKIHFLLTSENEFFMK